MNCLKPMYKIIYRKVKVSVPFICFSCLESLVVKPTKHRSSVSGRIRSDANNNNHNNNSNNAFPLDEGLISYK